MSAPGGGRQRRAQPEKRLTHRVVGNLEGLGFAVSKTSQPQKPVGMTEGIPDLHSIHTVTGDVWWEVKVGGNDLTPAQRAWHHRHRRRGGLVFTVWSVADVRYRLATHFDRFGALLPPIAAVTPKIRGRVY